MRDLMPTSLARGCRFLWMYADSKNAAYAESNIQPVVDDQSFTLNGAVKNEMQREMALQLARAYAGNRKIVDRLSVRP